MPSGGNGGQDVAAAASQHFAYIVHRSTQTGVDSDRHGRLRITAFRVRRSAVSARDLIKANLPVLIFNQRTVQEILDVILIMGRIVGAEDKARTIVASYIERLSRLEAANAQRQHKPRVYFEEWDEPTITAIEWVSELIELAGGRNVFADRAHKKLANERFVTHDEVIQADPEIVIASWCGKPFDRQQFLARPGFDQLSATRTDRIFEIAPEIILQPGPACLTAGLDWLEQHIAP